MSKYPFDRYAPFIRRFSPPGYEIEQEVKVFRIGLLLSVLLSLGFGISYLIAFIACHDYLYLKEFSFWVLNENAVMPLFTDILGRWLMGFPILSIVMLAFIPVHYMQYWQETKSIYVMRRLRKPLELHYRCWVIPVSCAMISLVVAFFVCLIYYGLYMLFTPAECLLPDQWQWIWRA